MKKSIFLITIFLFTILLVLFSGISYIKKNNDNTLNSYKKICRAIKENNSPFKDDKFSKQWYEHWDCDNLDKLVVPRLNIMGNYHNSINHSMVILFQYGIELMIFILIGSYFGVIYRSGYFMNELTRDNYKKIVSNHINKSYFLSLVIPFTGILIILMYSFVSDISPNLSNLEILGYDFESLCIPNVFSAYPYMIYILFILNLFILGILLTNIFLIVIRKIKNIIVAIFSSYIIYTIIEILLANILVFPGVLFLHYVMKFSSTDYLILYFDLQTVWRPWDVEHPLFYTCIIFSITMISSLIVKKIYNNKEKTIIESEK